MAIRAKSRRRRAARPAAAKPPRRMRLQTIDAQGAEDIFGGVLEILYRVGMQVEDDEARSLLTSAGCRDHDGRIFYPPDLVSDGRLEAIPAEHHVLHPEWRAGLRDRR